MKKLIIIIMVLSMALLVKGDLQLIAESCITMPNNVIACDVTKTVMNNRLILDVDWSNNPDYVLDQLGVGRADYIKKIEDLDAYGAIQINWTEPGRPDLSDEGKKYDFKDETFK